MTLTANDRAEIRRLALTEAVDAIPTNWCDPLLSGPDGIGMPPYDGPKVERLLLALRKRIEQAASTPRR